nr:RNA-dependent RNA polymerase [Umbelopsis gibberispora virus 1]
MYVGQIKALPEIKLEVTLSVYGVQCRALVLSAEGVGYCYIPTDTYIMTKNLSFVALVTRHSSQLYESVDYRAPATTRALFRDRAPQLAEVPQIGVVAADKLEASKVSAFHHIHYTAKEVFACVEPHRRKHAMEATRLPKDATRSHAAGLMLWFATLPEDLAAGVRSAGLFKHEDVHSYIKWAKKLSVEAKSLQNIVEDDLRSVFELDVLVNRISGDVDWAAEKENRQHARLAQLSEREVYSAAIKLFKAASSRGRAPRKMSWKEYWDTRWQWSAVGSVHSQYPEDETYVNRSDPVLKNKFITISSMPHFPHTHFTNRKPQIHAWSSTKYEWGKQRAIYGTDLTSYVIANWAFSNCENVLPRQFPVGHDANDRTVRARVMGILDSKMPFCLDFEDFNSQHSSAAMAAVVQAYADQFEAEFTPEQHAAAMWTAESIRDQTIHDNIGLAQTYKARGTLLSGWRLTTFINSVLNYIYTMKICGDSFPVGNSLHNGDDVLIGTRSLLTVRNAQRRAKQFGIRLQNTKCSVGAIAEFLRVDHKRGGRGQYLSRSVATMVHSRIESRRSTDARDLILAMEGRYADAVDRGMPAVVIANLRRVYYSRQAKSCGMTVEEMYMIKCAHRVVGGVSTEVDSSTDYRVIPGPVQQAGVEIEMLPGVRAYAQVIDQALHLNVTIKAIQKRVLKATYEAVLDKSRAMKLVKNEDPWYERVKRIYKAHKGAIRIAHYGKAALVGLQLELLARDKPNSTFMSIVNRSRRPLELLENLV